MFGIPNTLIFNRDIYGFASLLLWLSFFNFRIAYADARLIIHLTDYLANDYSGAISEEGKVLSEGEYAEQIEFSQTALKEREVRS